jgi:GH43 family beta-xylosidase
MDHLLVYTVEGPELYTNPGSPGLVGLTTDLDESVHLALRRADGPLVPLRHGTGVLFASADTTAGVPGGVTRTLVDPWILRSDDGVVVLAVRRVEGTPGRPDGGELVVLHSEDLVRWSDDRALGPGLAPGESVRRPRGSWDADAQVYRLEWDVVDATGRTVRREQGTSGLLREIADVRVCVAEPTVDGADGLAGLPSGPDERLVPGNSLPISPEESRHLIDRLGPIVHTGVDAPALTVARNATPAPSALPKRVTCTYSDGSTHEKPVDWDVDALDRIDTSVPGTHAVTGRVRSPHYPFPFLDVPMSDPCICEIDGRLFLTATDDHGVVVREASDVDGLRQAEPVEVLRVADGDEPVNIWAQEMHVIGGVPCVMTTVGRGGWTTVQAVVVRCLGDPADPDAWEEPRRVVRADGSPLTPDGISLDMTYFEVGGVHHVMWSGRDVLDRDPDHAVLESADLFIATIDPAQPWRLTSDPARILLPTYGWQRCEAPVVEGPYLLRRGQDLWVTVACASTGLPDLYCVGLLHATAGTNLLDPAAWDLCRYPVLTKESVPGQFGPGHNAFLRDPETGDDLLIYHAVPHDAAGVSLGRHMGVRRVHWAADGRPYLELTEEQDLDPALREVTLTLTVG